MTLRSILSLVFILTLAACAAKQPQPIKPVMETRNDVQQQTDGCVVEPLRPEGCDCTDRKTFACAEYCCTKNGKHASGGPVEKSLTRALPEGNFQIIGTPTDPKRYACWVPTALIEMTDHPNTKDSLFQCVVELPKGCHSWQDSCVILHKDWCILMPLDVGPDKGLPEIPLQKSYD